MLLVFLPRRKSFPFVVMIKKEAGNRGVVCRRSGFCHGEVSNTDCLFVVVVGFEAHTVGAFTPFSCSAASLCFGSRFRGVSIDFFRDCSLWLLCVVAFPRVNIYINIRRERERRSHGAVCLRLDTDFYACARVRIRVYLSARACVHTRGSQTRKWLLENTCSSIVRVSMSLRTDLIRISTTLVYYMCAARPHAATNISSFYKSKY